MAYSLLVAIDRASLAELHSKYAEMLAMRSSPERDEREIRRRMSRLAARFPGALREIDQLELAEIRRRLEALDAVLEGSGEEQAWMSAISLFHTLARGALAAKRWLGKTRRVDADTKVQFERDCPGLPVPEESRAWSHELAAIASPPRGRVTNLVLARVAAALGVEEATARVLVFGARQGRLSRKA